jgi:UDP-N-acetylglucosamine transferase subunit ALG13
MPRRSRNGEHVDDHQVEFSLELAKTGRIVVALESSDLRRSIEIAAARQKEGRAHSSPAELQNLVSERLRAYACAMGEDASWKEGSS